MRQADLEELGAGGEARRSGKRPARALELEARERRHSLHIARVEQVLRLLENEQARSALSARVYCLVSVHVHSSLAKSCDLHLSIVW